MTQTTVTLDGQSWVLDEDEITVDDAIEIENATDLSVPEMIEQALQYRGKALRALIWYLRRKAGEMALTPDDVKFKLIAVDFKQDPTQGDGTAALETSGTD